MRTEGRKVAGHRPVASPEPILRKTAAKRTLPQGRAHSRCGCQTSRAPRSPYAPPHSQVWSPSTCGHSFDEVGWFLPFLEKKCFRNKLVLCRRCLEELVTSAGTGVSAWVCVLEVLVAGRAPPQLLAHRGVGVVSLSGDHLGDCPLPAQALVTLTPSVPCPCALIPKPPDASWYMEKWGHTGTFLLARPLIPLL